MRRSCAFFVLPLFILPSQVSAQSPPLRDPKAVAVIETALAATGGAWPADVLATGRVTKEAGAESKPGTITLKFRGVDQSIEETTFPDGTQKFTFSKELAAEKQDDKEDMVSMELAATSQSATLPIPLLLSFLNDKNGVLEYVGSETIGAEQAHHIRLSKSYAGRAKLEHLTEFTTRDVWVAEKTGVPLRIAYQRRSGRGAVAAIAVEVAYADWRAVSGLLVPHRIEEKLNGSLWRTMQIEQVALNTGLTDTAFALPTISATKEQP